MPKITLYKNHKDSIGTWSIENSGNEIIVTYSKVIGGAESKIVETVNKGLASRTLEEQIRSRMNSRINTQLDKGYVYTLEEAENPPRNVLGFKQPMLAKKLSEKKNITITDYYAQLKLNGHRCLVTFDDDSQNFIAYSRKGKLIHTIDHILGTIGKFCPSDITLDGELYCHGVSLQTISSWAKRKQNNSLRLSYVVYDCMVDLPYKERYELLSELSKANYNPNIHMLKASKIDDSAFEPYAEAEKARSNKYEGLILRHENGRYEDGRRSFDLLKVKVKDDDEFKVIDINPSKDGWAILTCELKNGLTFDVSAPGTIEQKQRIMDYKQDYIGEMVTVEYYEITDDGKPFHPVALQFREDI